MGVGPEELNQAIDYFSKAVAIVPNPGEVVAAFEKTLPPPVFNALLDRIQRDVQSKVGEYFGGLLTSGKAKFVEMDTSGESGGLAKWWYPVAAVDMQIGGILWEEDADVVALVQSVEDRDDHCEHCLTLMEQDNRISCPACDCALYCSQSCQIKSSEAYHTFFCQPPEEVKAAMGQLLALCQENQSSLALLVLRYVAFLLSEELRGNGAANCGPFAHYDHLKPVFRGPNDMDRAEARLLRKIFSSTNQNIVEFLSDEIYTSMKATIARVLFTGGAISALTRHETRTLIDSSPTVSFFHISAHLGHSCDPNVVLLRDKASHARVVATKTIKKGERLITSYLAFPEGTCTAERQLHLMRIFGIHCQCVLCTDDLPSIA